MTQSRSSDSYRLERHVYHCIFGIILTTTLTVTTLNTLEHCRASTHIATINNPLFQSSGFLPQHFDIQEPARFVHQILKCLVSIFPYVDLSIFCKFVPAILMFQQLFYCRFIVQCTIFCCDPNFLLAISLHHRQFCSRALLRVFTCFYLSSVVFCASLCLSKFS